MVTRFSLFITSALWWGLTRREDLSFGTDPESYITEYTLVYEGKRTSARQVKDGSAHKCVATSGFINRCTSRYTFMAKFTGHSSTHRLLGVTEEENLYGTDDVKTPPPLEPPTTLLEGLMGSRFLLNEVPL